MIFPFGVNLMAFEIRFWKTWPIKSRVGKNRHVSWNVIYKSRMCIGRDRRQILDYALHQRP